MPAADQPSLLPVTPRLHGMGTHEGTWSLPSHSHRSGAHKGTPLARSPPPSLLSAPPPFTRKGACKGNAPSHGAPFAQEGVHKAKPSPPPHHAAGPPQRKDGHAGGTCPHPFLPAHTRGGTTHKYFPFRAGNASPATPTPHRTAHARKGRRQRPTPPHGPFQPHVYAPHHTRRRRRVGAPSHFHAGCTSRFMPRRRRVRGGHTQAHTHTKGHGTRDGTTQGGEQRGHTKGVRARQGMVQHGATQVPGGAACERRGVRIRAEVRKGEGDGRGVMNGARLRAQTAAPPMPVGRLRKNPCKVVS
ncbi:hypothetical protein EDB85DRAFT_1888664 [Lactarius pseudohatsudake]|nr:hypothetical protein EDB85DRAFT_1888664 [Lactarius pseudohatsudake]